MIWKPVFSPDGKRVLAKGERNGKFVTVLDGKPGRKEYDGLGDPVFGPEGDRVLVKSLEGSRYYRRVVSLNDL